MSKHENSSENSHEINNEGQQGGDVQQEGVKAPNEAAPDYPAIVSDLNDKLLRSAAELQNMQRRNAIDMQKAKHFSIESFARDLLGVMDNLCRAAESISDEDAKNDERLKVIKDGVEITRKELSNVFERNHIKRVGAIGETFDHNMHQAMVQIEDKDKPAGTIADVMMTGYIIKDRLLRPAMVVVTK